MSNAPTPLDLEAVEAEKFERYWDEHNWDVDIQGDLERGPYEVKDIKGVAKYTWMELTRRLRESPASPAPAADLEGAEVVWWGVGGPVQEIAVKHDVIYGRYDRGMPWMPLGLAPFLQPAPAPAEVREAVVEVPDVHLVAWEQGEKVIAIGGKVVGGTIISDHDGHIIRDWLRTAIREMWEYALLSTLGSNPQGAPTEGAWTKEKPTEAGWYRVRGPGFRICLEVKEIAGMAWPAAPHIDWTAFDGCEFFPIAWPGEGEEGPRPCDSYEPKDVGGACYNCNHRKSHHSPEAITRGMEDPDLGPRPSGVEASPFDFVSHLARQAAFSAKTFGPGSRIKGVSDHIRKELDEVVASGGDLKEWIDVAILALDGCWRSGATPVEIVAALVAKQTKNERRTWPDWRKADPDKAIEHDRTGDAPEPRPAPGASPVPPPTVTSELPGDSVEGAQA